jgi:hypothetical protein
MTMVLFLLGSLNSEASRDRYENDRYHHRNDRYEHHEYNRPVFFLPGKYFTITIGGQKYFHSNGRYYQRRHLEYVVVSEPVGVIISNVPTGCRKVYIDGSIYYTYNGNYYLQIAGGYRLVDRPLARVREEVSDINVTNVSPEVRTGDTFTVNVPNAKGGYTAIRLNRSGSGYIGPQGEYYPEFPKVEQLRAMYAN